MMKSVAKLRALKTKVELVKYSTQLKIPNHLSSVTKSSGTNTQKALKLAAILKPKSLTNTLLFNQESTPINLSHNLDSILLNTILQPLVNPGKRLNHLSTRLSRLKLLQGLRPWPKCSSMIQSFQKSRH